MDDRPNTGEPKLRTRSIFEVLREMSPLRDVAHTSSSVDVPVACPSPLHCSATLMWHGNDSPSARQTVDAFAPTLVDTPTATTAETEVRAGLQGPTVPSALGISSRAVLARVASAVREQASHSERASHSEPVTPSADEICTLEHYSLDVGQYEGPQDTLQQLLADTYIAEESEDEQDIYSLQVPILVEERRGAKRRFPGAYTTEPCGAFFEQYKCTTGKMAGKFRIMRLASSDDIEYNKSILALTGNSLRRNDLVQDRILYMIPFARDLAQRLTIELLSEVISCRFLPESTSIVRSETTGTTLTRMSAAMDELQLNHTTLKIGITSNPIERVVSYIQDGMQMMYLLTSSWEKGAVEAWEACLIDKYEVASSSTVRNKRRGGDGTMPGTPGVHGPWWNYVVVDTGPALFCK
jgi:hypothetical protein